MNREQVNAMTVDELRIKAAELMGWEWQRGLFYFCDGRSSRGAWCSPRVGDSIYAYAADTKDCVDDLPDYPNDIAAAWELVDKLHEQYEVAVFSDFTLAVPVTDEFWRCTASIDQMLIATTTDKDSASRAITRAFILAMEPE